MQSTSPTPPRSVVVEEQQTFGFGQAIELINNGARVGKREWPDDVYGFMQDERVKIHLGPGRDPDWIISSADIVGQDYYIIN